MLIQVDDLVLFQGDSITDAGRSRDNPTANEPASLGRGYVFYAAGLLHEALPGGKLEGSQPGHRRRPRNQSTAAVAGRYS